jgi:hypothetical protein
MCRSLLFTLLFVLPFLGKSQQNTFNEVFQTFGLFDITELPNGEFFFTAPRHGFTEHWGIRAYRLSSVGVILDSVSIWTGDHEHYTAITGHQLFIPEDSTIVAFWEEGNYLIGFNSYITRWQVYPSIDTLAPKKLVWNYPNIRNYIPTQTIRSQDGNIVAAGILFDTLVPNQVRTNAHIAKYDLNLNVLWETRVPTSIWPMGTVAMSIAESSDGSFVVAGGSMTQSGMANSTLRTWIAKTDSTGSIEWEYLFPVHNNDPRLLDANGNLALTSDGKIMMASRRAFDCPDFDPNCDVPFPLARIRLMKFDWDGTILKDTVIGPLTRMDGITSLQPVPNGGSL